MRYLGTFDTAEEAALAYARHVGKERAARETAEATVKAQGPLTAEQARAAAEREGLELIPANHDCRFRGVCHNYGKFATKVWEGGQRRHLGSFDTAEEAALAYARWQVGKERAAREAAEARGDRQQPLTVEQARAAVKREGLELLQQAAEQELLQQAARKRQAAEEAAQRAKAAKQVAEAKRATAQWLAEQCT